MHIPVVAHVGAHDTWARPSLVFKHVEHPLKTCVYGAKGECVMFAASSSPTTAAAADDVAANTVFHMRPVTLTPATSSEGTKGGNGGATKHGDGAQAGGFRQQTQSGETKKMTLKHQSRARLRKTPIRGGG